MIEVRPSRFHIADVFALLGWLLICYAVAAVGAVMSMSGLLSWYPLLIKPSFNPPDWVFGPVWTVLYTMMGISAWMVWRKRGWAEGQVPLGWFTLQLTLNMAWSGLFFLYENPGLAFVEIIILWITIAATTVSFWSVDRRASLLLVPYLAWVTFATVLNFAIWRLNDLA